MIKIKKFLNRSLTEQNGFTLIEILVVIGIIAILATVVLVAINPARQFKQARDTQRTSNVNAILDAVDQYIADNKGSYPTGIAAIVKSPTAAQEIGSGGSKTDLCAVLVPKYIPALPVDPGVDPDGATTTLGTGDPVPASSCGSYTTGYKIVQDTDANGNRITVSATGEITTDIHVTR